jgi:hypothetical protein
MKTENDGEESLEASPYPRCRSTRAAKIQPPGKERKPGRTEEGGRGRGETERGRRRSKERGSLVVVVAEAGGDLRGSRSRVAVLWRRRRCRGAGEGIRFRVASGTGRESGGGRSVIYLPMNGGP